MKKDLHVMVVDDEPIVCERLKPLLEKSGFIVETFTQSSQAIERLKEKKFHVVVTDLKMKAPTGMDILSFVKKSSPGTQVILITGYASIEANREAEAIGAFDFIAKPFVMKDLAKLVNKAAKKAHI